MPIPTTHEIEAACLLAWPALETVEDGHWVARFANGYTKRANSIQTHDVGDDADAPSRIDTLAGLYRARGLRPVFRVTPLTSPVITAALDAKGWDVYESSLVLAMDLPKRSRLVPATTRLFEPTDPEWAQFQGAMAGNDAQTQASLDAILAKLAVPARGIVVYDDALRPAGAALAINADGVAIFLNVVVDAQMRGQGFGRAVMNAALNWTTHSGARMAAIQVLADNPTAVPLYRSLGFADQYPYHYRRAPL
jgi:GNAT superfamily N-acetyltransferase